MRSTPSRHSSASRRRQAVTTPEWKTRRTLIERRPGGPTPRTPGSSPPRLYVSNAATVQVASAMPAATFRRVRTIRADERLRDGTAVPRSWPWSLGRRRRAPVRRRPRRSPTSGRCARSSSARSSSRRPPWCSPASCSCSALLATMFPQRVGPAALNLSVTDAMGMLGADRRGAFRAVERPPHPHGVRRAGHLPGDADRQPRHQPPAAGRARMVAHRGLLFGGSHPHRCGHRAVGHHPTGATGLHGGLPACSARRRSPTRSPTGSPRPTCFQLQKNHAGLLLAAGFLVAFVAGTATGLAARRDHRAASADPARSRRHAVPRRSPRPRRGPGRSAARARTSGQSAHRVDRHPGDLPGPAGLHRRLPQRQRPVAARRTNSSSTPSTPAPTRYELAIKEVWRPSLLIGGGLRYFTDPSSPTIAPHNLVISELAEVGHHRPGRAGHPPHRHGPGPAAVPIAARRAGHDGPRAKGDPGNGRHLLGGRTAHHRHHPGRHGPDRGPVGRRFAGATTLRERSSRLNWSGLTLRGSASLVHQRTIGPIGQVDAAHGRRR